MVKTQHFNTADENMTGDIEESGRDKDTGRFRGRGDAISVELRGAGRG